MRTSLNEIKEIDAYLHGKLSISDRLVFEARMLLSKALRQNVTHQQKVYAVIRYHHHIIVRQRLQKIHRRLFHDPENALLKTTIVNLFTS